MSSYLDELNEEQLKAVMHEGTPLLILAGAGSGKTKTLTYKTAHLIHENKAAPEEVLLVTFTNKAAGEMKERVEKVTGQKLSNVGTFHSLASRMLRRNGPDIGIDRDFVIYDSGDQNDLVKQIIGELEVDPKRFKPRSILSTISGAKQEMLTPSEYRNYARGEFQEVAAKVYEKYEKRLKEYTALDFDDLLLHAVRMLRDYEFIRERYQEIFKYVFVDEYQDTNTVQYVFSKLLSDRYKQLTVVGDASQSIYKWRGADYRNMQKLKSDYPNLTEIKLSRNYRSTQNILNAATQVINNNHGHPVLSLWTDSGDGEKITLLENYSASDEAKRVSEEILKITSSDHSLSQGSELVWKDIGVLYRTNAQSRAFEEMFIRHGIPYILVGGTKFYERKEIKDVLAYVRVMLNPKDGVSYKRAEKLGKRRLAKLMELRESYKLEEHSAEEILAKVLEDTQYLNKYDEEVEEDMSRLENIKELQAVASEFGDLTSFLENVSLVQAEYYAGEVLQREQANKQTSKNDTITLMTLHAAKGLEFPVVFMVGLEEGLFPHSRSLMERDEMEEERRLMYVGITRAKKRLYLSYAKSRSFWGSSGPQTKSRFIDEIDSQLISVSANQQISGSDSRRNRGSANFWKNSSTTPKTKTGIRIDSLSDDTLDDFLSGDISVDELLNR